MLSLLIRNQFIKRTFSNNAIGSPPSPQGTETFFAELIGQGLSKTAIGAGTGVATVGLTVYNFGPSVATQNEKLERFKQEQTQKFEIKRDLLTFLRGGKKKTTQSIVRH